MTAEETPDGGDDVLFFPIDGDDVVADLSENVANQLLTETIGSIQSTNAANRDSASLAQAHLRYALAKNFDEVGTLEGRAVSGVNTAPLGPPAS